MWDGEARMLRVESTESTESTEILPFAASYTRTQGGNFNKIQIWKQVRLEMKPQ